MRNGSDKTKGGEIASGELVVSRDDAPEILQPSEAALDDVALLVGVLVVPDAPLAIGFAGNGNANVLLFEVGVKRVRVIGFVGQEFPYGVGLTHSCALTQSAVLPGGRTNGHGLTWSSTIACVLLFSPPFVSPIA